MNGYYYLHTNGDLIFKKTEPEVEPGGFVRRVWPIDTSDRKCAWQICIQALALGANKERVEQLVSLWRLTDEDGAVYAERAGLRLFKDGASWCATFKNFTNLQESQAGFGDTALDAFVELERQRISLRVGAPRKGA